MRLNLTKLTLATACLLFGLQLGCSPAPEAEISGLETQPAHGASNVSLFSGPYADFSSETKTRNQLRIDKVLARGELKLYGQLVTSDAPDGTAGRAIAIGSTGHKFSSKSMARFQRGGTQLSLHPILDTSKDMVWIGSPPQSFAGLTQQSGIPVG